MVIIKNLALLCVGGTGYTLIELLWRGRSHYSMFLLGGLCFLAIGHLSRQRPRPGLALRAVMGAGICTAGELLFGLIFNRHYTVWDYRLQPGNFHGQICPLFTLLWIPVSLLAAVVFDLCDRGLNRVLAKVPG
jgi:hypothetical protein